MKSIYIYLLALGLGLVTMNFTTTNIAADAVGFVDCEGKKCEKACCKGDKKCSHADSVACSAACKKGEHKCAHSDSTAHACKKSKKAACCKKGGEAEKKCAGHGTKNDDH